jgi:hypothetical protein
VIVSAQAARAQGVFDSNHDEVDGDRYDNDESYREGVDSTLLVLPAPTARLAQRGWRPAETVDPEDRAFEPPVNPAATLDGIIFAAHRTTTQKAADDARDAVAGYGDDLATKQAFAFGYVQSELETSTTDLDQVRAVAQGLEQGIAKGRVRS